MLDLVGNPEDKFSRDAAHFFLFVLMLNVPVNNFSVILGRSHRFLGITSTFQGVNVSLLKDTIRQR